MGKPGRLERGADAESEGDVDRADGEEVLRDAGLDSSYDLDQAPFVLERRVHLDRAAGAAPPCRRGVHLDQITSLGVSRRPSWVRWNEPRISAVKGDGAEPNGVICKGRFACSPKGQERTRFSSVACVPADPPWPPRATDSGPLPPAWLGWISFRATMGVLRRLGLGRSERSGRSIVGLWSGRCRGRVGVRCTGKSTPSNLQAPESVGCTSRKRPYWS